MFAVDSHEFEGDDPAPSVSSSPSQDAPCHGEKERGDGGEGREEETGGGGSEAVVPAEYNPLIVRRSQRAVKPTKDVDLYLLGAKYGIDVEGSDADSSDQEFAPDSASDGEACL